MAHNQQWDIEGGNKPDGSELEERKAIHYSLPVRIQYIDAALNIEQIYREIMTKGWSEEKQHFVQYYGSDAVDASSLLMVTTKFTGSTEPRMLSTIRAIQKELTYGALVHRYNPEKAASDGTDTTYEGTFGACSFWMAHALAEAGLIDEGRLMLEKMLSYSNHVGLYAEEVGAKGEALGNFPQAFTHLALITTCYNIDRILDGSRKNSL